MGKLDIVASQHPGVGGRRVRGSMSPRPPQLELGASLGYMRPCHKINEKPTQEDPGVREVKVAELSNGVTQNLCLLV